MSFTDRYNDDDGDGCYETRVQFTISLEKDPHNYKTIEAALRDVTDIFAGVKNTMEFTGIHNGTGKAFLTVEKINNMNVDPSDKPTLDITVNYGVSNQNCNNVGLALTSLLEDLAGIKHTIENEGISDGTENNRFIITKINSLDVDSIYLSCMEIKEEFSKFPSLKELKEKLHATPTEIASMNHTIQIMDTRILLRETIPTIIDVITDELNEAYQEGGNHEILEEMEWFHNLSSIIKAGPEEHPCMS